MQVCVLDLSFQLPREVQKKVFFLTFKLCFSKFSAKTRVLQIFDIVISSGKTGIRFSHGIYYWLNSVSQMCFGCTYNVYKWFGK